MIPFCKPSLTGNESTYMAEALTSGIVCGDGPFTKRAASLLAEKAGIPSPLLTTSCTHALEMAALLAGIGPGDEVILPSFTFSSTANAFLLRGATLRFAEIDTDNLNLDIPHTLSLLTDKTRVIAPIDYAGVAFDIDRLIFVAKQRSIFLIQDAAQAVGSSYKGRPVGIDADIACYSFHETKNFTMGEGGALFIKDDALRKQAEIIREKGTDRSLFFRGEVDKYTWQRAGSSYLPSDVLSAMLVGQLERFDEILARRKQIYDAYFDGLAHLQTAGKLKRPFVPSYSEHNAHIFYILLENEAERDSLLAFLRARGVGAVFHYIPLHSAPAGQKLGYRKGDLPLTESISGRLLRLPLFVALSDAEVRHIIASVEAYFAG